MKESLVNAKLKIGSNIIPIGKTFSVHLDNGIVTIDYPDTSGETGISKRIELKTSIKDVEIIIDEE